MKGQMMKRGTLVKTSLLALLLGTGLALPLANFGADSKGEAKTQTLKGEVVDLMCYLDHGAKGEKHQGCARKCIEGGGPVGLLSGNDLYLVVGDHQPMNKELAPYAGQTVTLKGNVVERNGMKMLQQAELEK
jgi:hypothetical protein